MPDVKFYEQGKPPGDFMGVLDRIEARNEWAIGLDHTGYGNTFDPQEPHYQIFVNGTMLGAVDSLSEAQQAMQSYLDGTRKAPQ